MIVARGALEVTRLPRAPKVHTSAMRFIFKHSLLLRAGPAMAGIVLLALISMSSSMIIAEMLKGQAAAINQAGSLRMQSYSITTRLLAGTDRDGPGYGESVATALQEYEKRLDNPRLADVLPKDPADVLRAAYSQIAEEWQTDIKPLMSAYLCHAGPGRCAAPSAVRSDIGPLKPMLVTRVHAYVQRIDRFVSLLEDAAESKIAWLRLIQGMALFLTLTVVYLAMYLLYTDVVTPLRDLLISAEHARRGDFSARVRHSGEDELGRLGHAFNVMAEDLSKLYAGLESRVRGKTADLERRNRSLELLYHTITQLAGGPVSDAAYTVLLKRIEHVLGLGPSALCLTEGAGASAAFRHASTARPDRNGAQLCSHSVCADCLGQGEAQLREIALGPQETTRVFSAPLRDREQSYGVLQIVVPPGVEFDLWQEQIIETIGRHIGIALGTRHHMVQSRRLALLEERSVIARELHDSLAQSLSYLKIQVLRLQSRLEREGNARDSLAILDELRTGLNAAYRQLRELLTTFRLKMEGRGLSRALEATVQEFGTHGAAPAGGALTVSLDNRLAGCPLNVNEEIHILQIVREALSNVTRHAHAGRADVALHCDGSTVTISVDDDGVGYAPNPEGEPHHYGFVIMQERAHSLGGEVTIRRRTEGGTRVELQFTPLELCRPSNNTRVPPP
jgi:two-component system nitrate/nitrite sensor histidine kinase NarX